MDQNFLTSLKFTLQYEGGYSNNSDDPGGATNFGITQHVYNTYRNSKNLPIQSVKNISTDEMHEIYENNYWNAATCQTLPSGVNFVVFDLAVNNGVGRAKQFLVVANNLYPNGSPSDIIDSICDQRLEFDKSLGHSWAVFGNGWTRRIEGVRQQAKAMTNNGDDNG
jgi:lysozyme family protein